MDEKLMVAAVILRFPQILVETGFAPEWVELQKEIRLQTDALRKELGKCRYFRKLLGYPDINHMFIYV